MEAAAAGFELTMLEVVASSRSDTRGVFGMAEASGEPVVTPGLAMCNCLSKSSAAGIAARAICNPWSRIAIPVHLYPPPCATPCRSPYGSKCTRNGCTV